MPTKDYTPKVLYTLLIAITIMLGIMFIPSHSMGGVSIKRANIISDLIHFDDEMDSKFKSKEETVHSFDTSFFAELPTEVMEEIAKEDNNHNVTVVSIDATSYDSSYIHIEDYSQNNMMYKFYKAMERESDSRVVRIGICGDSFIEADIITADLREMLQQKYGGKGVGFVPFSHPLLKYRYTISSTAVGWVDYSAMKNKNIPDVYSNSMFISGYFSVPSDNGSRCYYKCSTKKKYIQNADNAKIIFSSLMDNSMTVNINDSTNKKFEIKPDSSIQCVNLKENINTFTLSVEKKDNFIGYGVCFDGDNGIALDNYSIRGNSGLCLFSSNKNVNSQIGKYLKYDLLVLQYGLNVMSDEIRDYSKYREQLKKIINYFKICFPDCAILVMGVSDRSKNDNGTYRSMNGIPYLISDQRKAAMETGVAFWNTFEAMGGEESIIDFVNKGWAGKDYTHINQKGGRYIAEQLFNSMTSEIEQMKKRDFLHEAINPIPTNLPNEVESRNERIIRIICKYDKSKHRIISRRYGRRIKKW